MEWKKNIWIFKTVTLKCKVYFSKPTNYVWIGAICSFRTWFWLCWLFYNFILTQKCHQKLCFSCHLARIGRYFFNELQSKDTKVQWAYFNCIKAFCLPSRTCPCSVFRRLGLWYSIFALTNRVRDAFIVSGSIQPLDLLDEAGTEPRPFFASEDPIHCATTYRRLFVNRHMSVRA